MSSPFLTGTNEETLQRQEKRGVKAKVGPVDRQDKGSSFRYGKTEIAPVVVYDKEKKVTALPKAARRDLAAPDAADQLPAAHRGRRGARREAHPPRAPLLGVPGARQQPDTEAEDMGAAHPRQLRPGAVLGLDGSPQRTD